MKQKHAYPSKYPKGVHWATDAAWDIMDRLKPGEIEDTQRFFLSGLIAGNLMTAAALGTAEMEKNWKEKQERE